MLVVNGFERYFIIVPKYWVRVEACYRDLDKPRICMFIDIDYVTYYVYIYKRALGK